MRIAQSVAESMGWDSNLSLEIGRIVYKNVEDA